MKKTPTTRDHLAEHINVLNLILIAGIICVFLVLRLAGRIDGIMMLKCAATAPIAILALSVAAKYLGPSEKE